MKKIHYIVSLVYNLKKKNQNLCIRKKKIHNFNKILRE